MAPKRKPQEEEKPGGIPINIGGKTVTITFRTALFLLVVSLTPLGEPVWRMLGVPKADDRVMASIERVEKRQIDMEAQLNTRMNALDARVTGFIDGVKRIPRL